MKFQIKHPQASNTDRFEFGHSYVTKMPHLGPCRCCNSMTRWMDVLFQVPMCSEECGKMMWDKYEADEKDIMHTPFDEYFKHVKEELKIADRCDPKASKDIIIVVHDQLPYFKECIESIRANTQNFHLYIWDNNSRPETATYLAELLNEYQANPDPNWSIEVYTSDENVGFIKPNNEMAAWGTSDYIILVNSDCKVFPMWDRALIGYLREHPKVGQVGFWGGHLDENGIGFGGSSGSYIDYVPGWCFCIHRDTYRKHGLFNKQLTFAYAEDCDLSLRLKEAGYEIYALYSPLLHHYQNKTIVEVAKEGKVDVESSFDHNHKYVKNRWANYLANQRVLLKPKTTLLVSEI